jgi:hypothetical protein
VAEQGSLVQPLLSMFSACCKSEQVGNLAVRFNETESDLSSEDLATQSGRYVVHLTF